MIFLCKNKINLLILIIYLFIGVACSYHEKQENNSPLVMTSVIKETKMSKFTQREFLIRTLEMMENAKSIHDFNREKLEQFFGIEMKQSNTDENKYYFGEKLTHNWWQGFEIYKSVDKELRFLLGFDLAVEADKSAKLNEICEMDFYEFVQLAESKGFVKTPSVAYDGVIQGYSLKKDNHLRIEVISEFYLNTPIRERNCIQMILIR